MFNLSNPTSSMAQTTPRIPCVVLAYFSPDCIARTLKSLLPLQDRVDVILVENPSEYSAEIETAVRPFAECGLVSRYFRFHENISGNAFEVILRREIKPAKHAYVIVSDGDLEPDSPAWLDESLGVMSRHPEVFCIGGSLDDGNLPVATFPDAESWLPPAVADHGDYVEANTGCFFLLFRGSQLAQALNYLLVRRILLRRKNLFFRDSVLHKYCYNHRKMRWARTARARFRHLTWDYYADLDHPYTQLKLSKSMNEHWEHGRIAGYTELLYGKP